MHYFIFCVYVMYVCLWTEVVHHGGIFLLCVQFVYYIYISKFHVQERGSPGGISNTDDGFPLECLSVKYCLCMQRKISFLIFRMLSVEYMIFSFSVIDTTSGALLSVFSSLSNDVPFYLAITYSTFFQCPYRIGEECCVSIIFVSG